MVNWLLDQDLSTESNDSDKALIRRFRERRLNNSGLLSETRGPTPGMPTWLSWLVWLVPPIWLRLRLSGRLPVISGSYRWFLKQPYLAPKNPGTFLGFAERLTIQERRYEDSTEVLKLSVNALLEDLRDAYRVRIWRPAKARRTTNALVLLNNASTENSGHDLLRLVNQVRNETGLSDPLLLVVSSEHEPDDDDPDQQTIEWPAIQAMDGLAAWLSSFLTSTRSRKSGAWYLLITAKSLGTDNTAKARRELARVESFFIPSPPLWARRGVVLLLAMALVASIGAAAVSYSKTICGRLAPIGPVVVKADPNDATVGCYGITDGRFAFPSTDPALDFVQEQIWKENQRVASAESHSTVIYFGAISNTLPRVPWESLAGVLTLQRRNNATQGHKLRVLIANGGLLMRHGVEVAEMIGSMAEEDRSIIGVVGLSQSRTPTVQTIQRLGALGIPIVASSLSADSLVEQSVTYFQISPQNRREAEVAAQYTDKVVRKQLNIEAKVDIVKSNDEDDTYSNNLTDDIERSFQALKAGYAVEQQLYVPEPPPARAFPGEVRSAYSLGAEMCKSKGLVFFAGRPEDFGPFLDGMDSVCGSRNPAILAGDAISRYLADPSKRALYPRFSLDYLTFSIGGKACTPRADAIYRFIDDVVEADCRKGLDPAENGYMDLAYDATNVFSTATKRLISDGISPRSINAAAVWHQISTMSDRFVPSGGQGSLDGETGRIDFRGTPNGQYVPDKLIAIIRVAPDKTTSFITCGQRGQFESQPWCPEEP